LLVREHQRPILRAWHGGTNSRSRVVVSVLCRRAAYSGRIHRGSECRQRGLRASLFRSSGRMSSGCNGWKFPALAIHTYSVQRQLTFDTIIAPATIGASNGPPATAMEYPANAVARWAGEYMSPKTPPVFVTGAEEKKPVKNRVIMML